MNVNFQQYHASVHATMQPRYLMHMHNNHHIQHLSYIIITMNLNIQQIMKQSYHNHHPIATMHASVRTSTTHAMCISRICACLLFSQCATLSPNGPHGIIDVPKGEWEERTNCPVTLQSASRSMHGCPALQPAINSSLSIIISPFVCLPFASLILSIKVCHTCTPKDSFS